MCLFTVLIVSVYYYSSTTVYIIRHGEKETIPKISDAPLTETGFAQARELGEDLERSHTIPILYISPMRRAKKTAEEISRFTHSKLILDDRLTEKSYRRSEAFYDDNIPKFVKIDETKHNHLTRLLDFFRSTITLFKKEVWIVAHGGLNQRLLEYINIEQSNIEIRYCSVFIYTYNKITNTYKFEGYQNIESLGGKMFIYREKKPTLTASNNKTEDAVDLR